MAKERIWLSPPDMGGNELKRIAEVFDQNWIAPVGPHLTQFEEGLSDFLGGGHVVATSSGTAALHLALILSGIQKGDKVLVQSFTFIGSANPVVYCGAVPVFVDSEENSWNVSPELVEKAISELSSHGGRPKALVGVDLYGMPASLNEISQLCAKNDIIFIEDAAESLGSEYMGRRCGSFGDFRILSFNGNKIITTSGGGALVVDNKELAEKARFLSTQARDVAPYYLHSELGFNYRLSNVLAGIGLGQMDTLDKKIERRRSVFQNYSKELEEIEGLSFLKEAEGYYSNRWLTTMLIEPSLGSPTELINMLEQNNIEARRLWKPLHTQPIFQKAQSYLNGVSERLFNTGICLPSGSSLKEDQQAEIIELIKHHFKA